jgi:hypothetical protein
MNNENRLPAEFAVRIISNATMKAQDIVQSMNHFVYENKEILTDSWIEHWNADVSDAMEFMAQDMIADLEELLNGHMWDLFNEIAPERTTFRSSEGDGSCFGFWFDDEEEDDDDDDDEEEDEEET